MSRTTGPLRSGAVARYRVSDSETWKLAEDHAADVIHDALRLG